MHNRRGRMHRWWALLVVVLVGGTLRVGLAHAAGPFAEPSPHPPLNEPEAENQVPPAVCAEVRRLHRLALRLTRLDPAQADALARSLGYSPQASAGLMCAPLSVYVLRQVGLAPPSEQPAAYWLLDPQRERDKVQRLFGQGFLHDLLTGLPSRLDFRSRPFIPGDVLYFYSGSWGTFSHMMVVTYVDRAGRAYGLSNLNTPRGYIVREVMLYDPARPGVGQLARWNDPRWAWLGLTGFGGVEVWRPVRWAPYASGLGRGACAEPPAPGLWLWDVATEAQAAE